MAFFQVHGGEKLKLFEGIQVSANGTSCKSPVWNAGIRGGHIILSAEGTICYKAAKQAKVFNQKGFYHRVLRGKEI